MSCIMPYQSAFPQIAQGVFVAPTASVVGDVTIGKGSSVWFGAHVRGDFQPLSIGEYTNIQDNATVHVMGDVPTEIGSYVTIGHNAIVHCRTIGDNCLIGMGSIVLGYSEIGNNCIIGAGTLLTQYKKIPANSLVYGNPARIIRALRDDEIAALKESARNYHLLAADYLEDLARSGASLEK
ncbi:MAG: gamma carbonic anhydrase family protein [Selenomonadaceae bacterium]|nr:gamma carbonic anhydrase family protein [Selenomonadaceae bacterium]